MASFLQRAVRFLSSVEDTLVKTIYFRLPPEYFSLALVDLPNRVPANYNGKSLIEILKETLLWAVPKKRKSIEKRRSKRFGHPDYVYKMLLPKKNLIICDECGHYKVAYSLCPTCYEKVRAVTTEMQEAIEQNLGITPVDKEVVVVYSDDEKPEYSEGMRIVEMQKERPKLFSDNLLQKSTQGPATTKDITEKKKLS